MTAAEAIADVERTIALWRADRLRAKEAWFAVTGRHVMNIGWEEVSVVMVRIALGRRTFNRRRLPPPPMWFPDHLPAMRDHGSAAKLVHPGARLAA